MSADYTHNRASFRKHLLSMIRAPVLRRGDAGAGILLRCWLVSLLISIFFALSGLFSFGPCIVMAKESDAKLGSYEAIVSKDPFDPERGKNENLADNDTTLAEGDLKDCYQVYGTIIAGGVRLAYLKVVAPKSSKPLRRTGKSGAKDLRTVVIGDLVDGWRVEDITAQGVKFESDGKYVEVGIFDEIKKERKATAPVALQTPHPEPQVRQAPQSTPAKNASSSKPDSRSQKESSKMTSGHSKKRPTKKSQEITGETESDKQVQVFTPSAPSKNSFLELIKKSKEK
jgi:hypothetical protein